MASDAAGVRSVVEGEAEVLVAYQLDLLAQLECQLRAVHRTMRQIEKLRSATARREGATPSNGEKLDALQHLTREVEAIDRELATQHESCGLMLETVETMRGRLDQLRQSSGRTRTASGRQTDAPPATTRNRRRR
jgi:phage-related tail protein